MGCAFGCQNKIQNSDETKKKQKQNSPIYSQGFPQTNDRISADYGNYLNNKYQKQKYIQNGQSHMKQSQDNLAVVNNNKNISSQELTQIQTKYIDFKADQVQNKASIQQISQQKEASQSKNLESNKSIQKEEILCKNLVPEKTIDSKADQQSQLENCNFGQGYDPELMSDTGENKQNQMSYSIQIKKTKQNLESNCTSQKQNFDTYQLISCLSFDNFYSIISKDILINQIIKKINQISQIYSISSGKSLFLLRNSYYNLADVFISPDCNYDHIKIQYSNQLLSSQNKDNCLLCNKKLGAKNRYSLECKHYFCINCYQEYIKSLLDLGSQMLCKTCPLDKCQAKIGWKEISELLVKPKQLQKAKNILFSDFLQLNKCIKACPFKNCENTFLFNQQLNQQINLTCTCEESFSCSSCQEQAHLPLSCEQYKQWMKLISTVDKQVFDNLNYITKHTKACPNCKVAIEKNGGCMHMQCQNCKSHFCWACLQITTNFSHSNYCKNEMIKMHENPEIQQKHRLEKYQERFLYYKQMAQLSKEDYQKNITVVADLLNLFDQKQNAKNEYLPFRIQAFSILYEAKYVLAYSMAVCYFNLDGNKLQFLEYLQNNLEIFLNKFEYHITQEIKGIFNQKTLTEFKTKNKINLINMFEFYNEETKQFTEQVKQSLRNLVTQVQFDYPNLDIFNLNRHDLLIQDEIENQIKNQKVYYQPYDNNSQQIKILMCSYCKINIVENDFGMCQQCFQFVLSFE